MKTILLVTAVCLLLVGLSGCQCGCLNNSGNDSEVGTACQRAVNPDYPIVSTQMEIQADYGKSF